MDYADGANNTVRPDSLTYPSGRVVTYNYGVADGITDATSRIARFMDSEAPLAAYSYLGLGMVVFESRGR